MRATIGEIVSGDHFVTAVKADYESFITERIYKRESFFGVHWNFEYPHRTLKFIQETNTCSSSYVEEKR